MHIKRPLPHDRHLYGLPKNHGPKTLPPANGPESVLPGGLALLQGTSHIAEVNFNQPK